MQTAITLSTTVLPGHRIEITDSELREGQRVAVTIADDAATYRRYPSAIEAEYDLLIEKELHGTLTMEDACRLQEVCRLIDDIDRFVLKDDIRMKQLDKIEVELKQLRAEIEALPDL